MGKITAIGWTHHTFNPWRGCSHAVGPHGEKHPGCLNCYAEFLVCEKFQMGKVKGEWGPGAPRTVAAESGWALPVAWARAAAEAGERRRCFFSLGDPLDEEAPKEAQQRFWQLIRETFRVSADARDADSPEGGLDWLLLTKRPWRWELIPEDVRPLVWLGTSISDQATADVWVPALREAQGFRRRFLSVEPMVGPVELRDALGLMRVMSVALNGRTGGLTSAPSVRWERSYNVNTRAPITSNIDWVICGGESGGARRPAEVQWFADLAVQCDVASIPFFMKQDTAYRAGQQGRIPDALWALKQVPGEVRRGP